MNKFRDGRAVCESRFETSFKKKSVRFESMITHFIFAFLHFISRFLKIDDTPIVNYFFIYRPLNCR